jgi:hypothetical protein
MCRMGARVSAEAFPLIKMRKLPIEGLGVLSGSFPSTAETRIALMVFVLLVPPSLGDRSIE